MKLTCLNIQGGKIFAPLMAFVREQSAGTDFFCFQETFDTPSDETRSEIPRSIY